MTRVAYLGPAGTWTEAAVLADPVSAAADPLPQSTIHDALEAVDRGDAEYAVVPIQNSLEGGVNTTLDTLVRLPDLQIVGESTIDIHHCLIVAPGIALTDVTSVASHAQAIGQCQAFLRERLPRAVVRAVPSTAQAVQDAVRLGEGRAAIGTATSAELYGGEVLLDSVEDEPGNVTRFVAVTRAPADESTPAPWPAADGEHWRTSLVFWGRGDDEAGWLVRCLDEFATRELNLSRIESRPRRGRLESYLFFVDLEARSDDAAVVEAVDALRERCEMVRMLGSYPAA